jgi:membrane protein
MVDVLLSVAAGTLLFFAMFRLLANPDLPSGTLWRGALLAAGGFELLTTIVVTVLGGVGGTPFAPLAVAVTLAIWINYFSRLVLLGAAWAWTADQSELRSHSPDEDATAARKATGQLGEPSDGEVAEPGPAAAAASATRSAGRRDQLMSLVSGAAIGAGAASVWWSARTRSRLKRRRIP